MKQQAVISIKRDDNISPVGPDVYFPCCPLCDNEIEEIDDVEILISRGSVCLTHKNCDEIEDEPEGEVIDNDTGRLY